MKNKITQKLKKLNLKHNAVITLQYQDSRQVTHYTGDYLDDVLQDTNAIWEVSHVVSYSGIRKFNSVINEMRINGLLNDYKQGSFDFDYYVQDVMQKNWTEYLENDLEHWDHKRGKCSLSTEVKVPLNLLAEAEANGLKLDTCWKVLVHTDAGLLELDQ